MRVLVTGGAGFIGSHLVEAFVDDGHEVVVVDDLSTGKRENLRPGVRFIELDVRSPEIAGVVDEVAPDAICHQAAQMDVRRSVADPVFDAEVNVLGTVRLLEAARRARVRRFLFASSGGAAYGEQDRFPAREDDPTRPVSPYGVSKRSAEHYLFFYGVEYGLSWTALRYANVYGPRQDPHGEAGVVAIFSEKILAEEPPRINGDGKQTRDYVFVSDVVEANRRALDDAFVGALNVGTGRETDVNELAALLLDLAGSALRPEHAAPKPGEQRRSVIDPALARDAIGWEPRVSLEDGLRATFDWFRERRGP